MIESISDLNFDKKRVRITLTDGEEVIIFKATVKEYCLRENQEISFAEVKKIAKEGEEHIAFTTAIDSLTRGLKSQNEIKQHLKLKKFSQEAIDITIEKLLGYGYLGDEQYAEAFVSYKGEKMGRRKIIYDLVTIKGIPKNVAEKIVYDNLSDEAELEKALSLARKYIEKEKKKRTRLREKTYSFLATRGFDSEIISSAMSKLDFKTADDEF